MLVAAQMVRLSRVVSAPIEINLFHRSPRRERAIAKYLMRHGAKNVLGIGAAASQTIRGIASPRRKVDPTGIGSADVVLIPLEDGDRAEALKQSGRKIIAIDLNPLSRTSQVASISIVDNVVRAIPALVSASERIKQTPHARLERLANSFDNQKNLRNEIQEIILYLRGWTKK